MKNQAKNAEIWMPCPRINIDFPGLAYICPLTELIVAKKLDVLHEVIGRKGVCYTIFNNDGQKIFLAVQRRRCRRFDLKIFNHYGNEVIQIKKPCTNKVQVLAPPGRLVGYVEQSLFCGNAFAVKNSAGVTILKVKSRSSRGVYDVLSGDELVGQIKKEWCVKVVGDTFGVSFPLEMDVGDKAVLLGACFLIGYLKY